MGIVVTDSITTSSPTDIYATHDAHLGRGGYRSVLTYNELLATTGERKTEGMLVYVKETDKEYRWIDGQWVSHSVSSGIGEVLPTDNMDFSDSFIIMKNGNILSFTLGQLILQLNCEVEGSVMHDGQVVASGGEIVTYYDYELILQDNKQITQDGIDVIHFVM